MAGPVQVTPEERLRWEVQQLEHSDIVFVTDSELDLEALCYRRTTTWIAGGGNRANLKFEGLSWGQLRELAVRFDHG